MARSINTIQAQIIASVQADKNLYDPTATDPTQRGLTSTSQVAIWNLWTYVVAVAISLWEQLMDIFIAEVEANVALSAPGTPQWIQQQCFLFQWSATSPQIIQFDTTNFNPYYPLVNEALRIVTQAAVQTTPNKIALIKVAANSAPLTTPQYDALTSYLDFLNFAGIYFELRSVDADFIMLGYDLYYDGQYSGSIVNDTTAAINNFLSSSNFNNFNGKTYLSKIEDVLQAVPGMVDVVAKQVEVRPASIIAANATIMVNAGATLLRFYQPYAGYMVVDTDTGRTLADTLNFIVSNN
jgi:hypothetical protein